MYYIIYTIVYLVLHSSTQYLSRAADKRSQHTDSIHIEQSAERITMCAYDLVIKAYNSLYHVCKLLKTNNGRLSGRQVGVLPDRWGR